MAHDIYHHRPTLPETEQVSSEEETTNTQQQSAVGRIGKTSFYFAMLAGQIIAAREVRAQEEIPAPPPDVPAVGAKSNEGERRFSIEPKADVPSPLEEVVRPELNEKVMSTVIRIMEDWGRKNEAEYKRALLAQRAMSGDAHALETLKNDAEFSQGKRSFRIMGARVDPLYVIQSKLERGLAEKAKALVSALNLLHARDLGRPLTTEEVVEYQRAGLRLFIERENDALITEIASQEKPPVDLAPAPSPLTAIGEKDQ